MAKKEKSEWVLVDTVSSFRVRYMVEVPKGKAEYALEIQLVIIMIKLDFSST